MTLSQNDTDTAAREVIRDKLARGISHAEIEMILNGAPGKHIHAMDPVA